MTATTSALECLRAHGGTLSRAEICQRTGLSLQDAYTELVAAEAAGKARVVIKYIANGHLRVAEWEALPDLDRAKFAGWLAGLVKRSEQEPGA